MYLADSISFKPPSETSRVFPNKKTSFSITYAPKSIHVRTTLEYFTIYSVDDQLEGIEDESYANDQTAVNEKLIQKVTVCVKGSCYGIII